ncbi:uncharacterized protein LOC107805810 [Nicotiana tabacum]|uniref:Uncharacterized protein LOC107805810 n=2 Tax=Nicotiana TaxID=4085 RepID=A0A1S4B9A0_TOBAC|nr:PREDICTED: uncharacterized protein LOC104213349 [Nicotiana sylvestris]XP_016485378.1 PREDICTED: uncharacterized protein LOC107805810 [Nicotiana tabacum]
MKNAIRCCISCILPCGALDVIRIVHANGKVEEISETHVKAAEIMKLYPKHVLKKPSTSYSSEGVICPKIVVLPPDAELQRGKIYFLMPIPASSTEKTRSRPSTTTKKKKTRSSSLPQAHDHGNIGGTNGNSNSNSNSNNLMVSNDQYLSEILSEKISTQRDRRRGRVGVWRPHLESISETSSDQP